MLSVDIALPEVEELHRLVELGLEKGFEQVVAQAVSPSGQELARGPFPQAAQAIRRAIGAAVGPAPSELAGVLRKP